MAPEERHCDNREFVFNSNTKLTTQYHIPTCVGFQFWWFKYYNTLEGTVWICMKNWVWNLAILTQKWPQYDKKVKKMKNSALTVSTKDWWCETTTLSDTGNFPKCWMKSIVPFKTLKMGHYVGMTRQNQPVFLYAPIYKYQSDVTMTYGWDTWTIRNVRTDQNTKKKDHSGAMIWKWSFWTVQPK